MQVWVSGSDWFYVADTASAAQVLHHKSIRHDVQLR